MTRVHAGARWLIAISLVVMSISGYASNQLLDEDSFAELISNSVKSPEVRELLAIKAVDVAIDASDADALLADALPDEYSLVATPALELSKPVIAEAGATLLGVDLVGSGLETAARSVHRQTSTAILAVEETDVVINTLPVLVVVADEIAGDVGARAAVGLNLPDSATSINLGSNQSPAWSIFRSLSYVAAAAAFTWFLAMVVYFVSAGRGQRLAATRRLARTYVKAGIVLTVFAWTILIVAAVALEVALSPGETLSFGKLSLTGASGGGAAFAEVILSPLIGSARRTLMTGLLIFAATYVFGRGVVASGLRQAVRHRDGQPLLAALASELPARVNHVRRAVLVGFAVLLLVWPQITLRVALTLLLLTLATMVALAVQTSDHAAASALRSLIGTHRSELACRDRASFGSGSVSARHDTKGVLPHIKALDVTNRSPRATANRRWLVGLSGLVALLWPSYEKSSFVVLMFIVAAAFALTYHWELRPADATAEALALRELDEGWPLRRKLAVGGVVIAGLVFSFWGGGTSNPASASSFALAGPAACNGHIELCDRPLDQVVFAGTHNSMSSSALGWELANHEGAIPAQLAGGVRALLIDVQYWPQGESIAELGLDPEAAEIAARALAVDAPPEDGLWMCHKLCQLGGTPFSDFLGDLRAFLETNPDEVLVIVIQDDAPADDIKAAIENASIDDYAFAHEPGAPWPTLTEMIHANERLVFLAENEADASGWYQLAFDGNVSETGFRYSVIEDFDCEESRGGDDGAFFMINHWVETGLPVPAEADRVNATDVLQERVGTCERDRGRRPGIIAVNFWERGDLLSFVDELNGIKAS